MRRRGTISFQQKNSRPPLSRGASSYWLDMLRKIIKIGTEFEINLPSPEAALDAPDNAACTWAVTNCAKDCVNTETCMTDRHPTFCLTRETGKFLGKEFTCPATDDGDTGACQACPAWYLNCRSTNCAMFTPFCTVCSSFGRNEAVKPIEKMAVATDEEEVRRQISKLLMPTAFVGQVGKHGVLEVKKDGSLHHNGGIEVPTVGRRVHWHSFYQMCKDIIDPIVERGGYINERCGQHFHVLAGYLNGRSIGKTVSELEQPLPEIILANFHQLCRRYELAMFWLMSTGENSRTLTRWAKFRIPIFQYSALNSKMRKIQEELSANIEKNGKYAANAYHFCEFDENGNVTTFHVENRIADGCLSPAVVTAWAMMIYATVLKAVRLSQYGVMEVGNKEYIDKVREIAPKLINGQDRGYGDNRFADTSYLTTDDRQFLQENALEFVDLLKNELMPLGQAYPILVQLAHQPVSIRRIEGQSWQQIEETLYRPAPEISPLAEELQEMVDLAQLTSCESQEAWQIEAATLLGQGIQEVQEALQTLSERGNIRWSSPVGTFISS